MKIYNKKARFDYQLFDRIEAGLMLNGSEAKAIHTGHADISRSFARMVGGELFLLNANIPVTSPPQGYNPLRSRKLLVHKKELFGLAVRMKQQKLTLVLTSLYTKGRLIKAELALAKSKRKFEKKQTLKARDIQRDVDRELK